MNIQREQGADAASAAQAHWVPLPGHQPPEILPESFLRARGWPTAAAQDMWGENISHRLADEIQRPLMQGREPIGGCHHVYECMNNAQHLGGA